jgi:hypothetical protein
MEVWITHTDTCFADFLQDHHNREGELLVGVPVDGGTTVATVKSDLLDEASSDDRLPEDVTDDLLAKAIEAAFSCRNDDSTFDPDMGTDWDDDLSETPTAWFLIQWGSPSEADTSEDGE